MQTSSFTSSEIELLNIEWEDGEIPLTFINKAYFTIAEVSTLKLHYFYEKTNPLIHEGVDPVLSTMLHDV